MSESARRLAAIMFTDVVGYTSLAQKDEANAMQVLKEERSLLRGAFSKHGGVEIKTIGDAFLVEFPSALEAARCAVAIQSAIRNRNEAAASPEPIQVRIGVHVGDVIHSEDDILGDAVNVASRIEPMAEPGGICITEQVFHDVRNKLENPIVSLGRIRLKNVDLPVEIYKVIVTPWEKSSTTSRDAAHQRSLMFDSHRVAILPMTNMSSEPDEYFSDGMTEELISAICTISGLRVISRTSAMTYKNTTKSIPEIGKELNVGSIIEGSVRKSGDRVRITVQLIDVGKDEHLWSHVYDRSLEDVFEIQSDIAREVSEGLKVSLPVAEKQVIERTPTKDAKAHDLFLKGRYHQRKGTEEELRTAAIHYEQAIRTDPNYASAYVGLADCYIGLCDDGCLEPKEAYAKVEPLVKKALELDDKLPEAHATMAHLTQFYQWDWDVAEKGFRHAIELNPNWSNICQSYGVHLALRGRFLQAITEIKRAEELDPYSIDLHDCAAEIYRVANNPDSAIEECNRMLELDPSFVPAFVKLGKTYLQKSMFDQGLKAMEMASELSHGGLLARSYLAYAYGVVGRKDSARALISELEGISAKRYVSPFNLAIAYSGLRDPDMTMYWLLKAYDQHSIGVTKVKVDPIFDFLRSDSRFADLQRKIGLVES
ncbi:MAG TPA: adenylate/guanylate cyclase domain-containing protein [Nitrososphaerales archaeon]|nr:adenylate/guanylate cyclase domain-containing protein [Nitrososphaerales archaeon]